MKTKAKPSLRDAASMSLSMPLVLFVLSLLFYVAAVVLHPVAADPDAPFEASMAVGAFLVFLYWAGGAIAWGMALVTALRLEGTKSVMLACAPALGTAALAIAVAVLGVFGWIGPDARPALNAVLVLGHVLNVILNPGLKPAFRPVLRPEKPSVLFWCLPAVLLWVTASLSTIFLAQGGDDVRYHLLGPWLWSDAGHIFFPRLHLEALQCSYWDYLFIWGDSFLGGPGGAGLIEGHYFGSWVHAVFGYGACFLALWRLLRSFARSERWAIVAATAGLSIHAFTDVARYAKNDFGVNLWFLSGLILVVEGCRKPRELVAAGALIGLAFGGKVTIAFSALPAALAVVWCRQRAEKGRGQADPWPRAALWCGAGFAAAAAPALLRNALWTGNPVFPAMGRIFPSWWLSPGFAAYQSNYEAAGIDFGLRAWSVKLMRLCADWPLVPLLLAWLPFRRLRPALARPLDRLVIAGVLGFVLFSLMHPAHPLSGTGIRLLGPALMLIVAASVLALEQYFAFLALLGSIVPVARSPRSKGLARVESLAAVLVLALAVSGSRLQWEIWGLLGRLPRPDQVVRELILGGESQAWLRMNARPDELIVTSGFDVVYYLAAKRFTILAFQPELDREVGATADPERMLAVLRDYDSRYLLDVRHWYSYYWNATAAKLDRLALAHPSSIAFAARDSFVVDLARLEEQVAAACVLHPYLRVL